MTPRPEESIVSEKENRQAFRMAQPLPGEEVVISGMSGSFPDCDGMYMFRDKLMGKVDLISDDDRRWLVDHPHIPQRTGKLYNIEKFDTAFFGFNTHQTNVLEPIIRIALERVYEAIVDAGVNPASLAGTNTSVYVGFCYSESDEICFYNTRDKTGAPVTNCSRFIANRISYWLGLVGESYIIDTACSSSMYALERAYSEIRAGKTEAAIVVGCSLCLNPLTSLQFFRLGVLSWDGLCKCFDNSANGYARSEAMPVAFIQKSKDAKRSYARIVHVKTNCDGFKEKGTTFPSSQAQQKLFNDFYEECGVNPADISFMEAHGTGTVVGDPEECNAIDSVFCKGRKEPLLFGSVKSNMGHSEAASGLCSVAKAIIALETGIIPPNMNYSTPRETIRGLIEGRMKVVTDPTPMPGNKGLIAINSFGFGGANAHVLLEQNKKEKINEEITDNIPRIVTVSGRTEEAVKVILDDVKSRPLDAEFIQLLNDLHSENIQGHNYRGYAIYSDKKEIFRRIERSLVHEATKKLCFVFPDLGGETLSMAEALLTLPIFAKSMESLQKTLNYTKIDLLSILKRRDSSFDNVVNVIVGVVAVQIGLVDCFFAIGVSPEVVVGYSIGELACAYAVKNITAQQAIQAAYFIGNALIDANVRQTCALIIGLSKEELMKDLPEDVEIFGVNEPEKTTVVGPVKVLRTLKERLRTRKIAVEEMSSAGVGLNSSCNSTLKFQLSTTLAMVIPEQYPRSHKWITALNDNDEVDLYCLSEYFIQSILNPVNINRVNSRVPENCIPLTIGSKSAFDLLNENLGSLQHNLLKRACSDGAVEFLSVLGRLYTSGITLNLTSFFPAVKYPVSRGTPMISPLVRWDHSQDWLITKFSNSLNATTTHATINISLNQTQWSYLQGHMIDGRVIFPATGYIKILRDALEKWTANATMESSAVFEEVQLHRATHLSPNVLCSFEMSYQPSSGRFEIMEGGTVVVTGYAKCLSESDDPSTYCADPSVLTGADEEPENFPLQGKDVYKELRLRGYNYSGEFRGVQSCNSRGDRGLLAWEGNWVSFMDAMFQIQLINMESRDLYIPTYIGKIIISPKIHAIGSSTNENRVLPVRFYKNLNIIKSGGVEIWDTCVQQIPRKKPLGEPVLEKYVFSPHFTTNEQLQDEAETIKATRNMIHLGLENIGGIKVKVIEIADEALSNESILLAPYIKSILGDLPLIQAEVRVISEPGTSRADVSASGITVESKALSNEKDCTFIVGSNLLGRTRVMESAVASLKEFGFIITREAPDHHIEEGNFSVLATHVIGQEMLVLLRREKPINSQVKVISITSDLCFSWIASLKSALASDASRVILLAEKDETSGILGLTNCLLREPSGSKVRCVYIRDKNAPPFDLHLPFYADQLAKDLVINVLEGGVWGSYRHQILENQQGVPSKHIYVNSATKGDLSSLSLFQGNLNKIMENEDMQTRKHVKVYYASINFRDVMVASGKIVLPASLSKSSEVQIGLEFSGINEKGERVMGLLERGAMSSVIDESYTGLTWPVPDSMSLEEAATIPILYSTVYLAFVRCGHCIKGESVLIHSAAGGIGITAITLALHFGLEIFVTVGTAEKKQYILENYPQIPESHIGNSRDTSFEDMIKRETNNRGVDMVLNSLSEEKLEASLRCLAVGGRFFEIGKYDLLKNVPIAMEPFLKNSSYHCIMLHSLLSDKKLFKIIEDALGDVLQSGAVRPLPRTVFDISEPEKAFRYMTTGKHIGKVLMKLRDENEPANVPKVFNAVPRYFCNSKSTYIILGGLGGFGLELANWLLSRGAKYLVLTSRFGTRNGYQSNRVNVWRRNGIHVHISTDDVSTEEGVAKLLTDANNIAPVAGIFNLAVVLQDSVFENQTEDSFRVSFLGKATATALLDKLSRKLCPELEEFVVFSSVSCGRGNAGQTNYGMSNSVMERICEQRKAEGFPGLAVQWGAIGEVGLVAQMAESNLELVIGGTLQQTIRSCLECMDTFLRQDSPIVASMVVAEKRSGRKSGATMVETVLDIIGIKDRKTISHNTSLAELGMDSMTAVEIKQCLEREFEVFLTAQDLRGMTFSKLAALDAAATKVVDIANVVDDRLQILIQNVPSESESAEKLISLKTASADGSPVFIIPGLDGFVNNFDSIAKDIFRPMFVLKYPYDQKDGSAIIDTARAMLPIMQEKLGSCKTFTLVGYSAGGLVSLELTALLEASGLQGHLIILDGSPALLARLSQSFYPGGADIQIENLVLMMMHEYFQPGDKNKMKYFEINAWDEKSKFLIDNVVPDSISPRHVNTVAKDYINRLKAVYTYKTLQQEPLSSKITLIVPKERTVADITTDDHLISELTKQPVKVFEVDGNHVTMLNAPMIAKVINEER